MKKLTIAVGTTSAQKIGYLKDVLKELGIKAVIKPIEVASGVSDQPKSSSETKQGSINRAVGAINKNTEADFGIGIEVGYHKYLNNKNKFEIFCWCTIVDNQGYQISGQSYKFLLPEYHQKVLSSGKYLGHHLNEYYKGAKDSINLYLKEMIRSRKPFIEGALKDTLIKYFKREDY